MSATNTSHATHLPVVTPAFAEPAVSVVFATDQNYLPYLAVCLRSLVAHADPQRRYDICILNDGQLDTSAFPRAQLERDHIRIRFVTLDLRDYPYDFSAHLQGRYTVATYYRFFIGEVFARYPRVLYLDTDIIILSDVAELFDYDLGEHIFAGGADRCHFLPRADERAYITESLGVDFARYFCAGVMLMDVPRMRAAKLLARCLRQLEQIGVPRLVDQDVLNVLFADATKVLPSHWNVMWSVFLHGTPEQVAAYKRQALPAKIIHYDSSTKPWNAPEAFLADQWWHYARELGMAPSR